MYNIYGIFRGVSVWYVTDNDRLILLSCVFPVVVPFPCFVSRSLPCARVCVSPPARWCLRIRLLAVAFGCGFLMGLQVFMSVQKAFDTLTDLTKRRAYDSSLEFDDNIPGEPRKASPSKK